MKLLEFVRENRRILQTVSKLIHEVSKISCNHHHRHHHSRNIQVSFKNVAAACNTSAAILPQRTGHASFLTSIFHKVV